MKSEKHPYPPLTAPQDEKQAASIGRPAMATIQDDDERLLARIGYKQVWSPRAACNASANPIAGATA